MSELRAPDRAEREPGRRRSARIRPSAVAGTDLHCRRDAWRRAAGRHRRSIKRVGHRPQPAALFAALGLPSPVKGIRGDIEIVQLGCAVSVFFYLPLCQLKRGNVLVGVFTKNLRPRWRAMFDLAANLLFLVLAAMLALQLGYGTADKFRDRDTTMVLRIPEGWAYGAALAASGCSCWSPPIRSCAASSNRAGPGDRPAALRRALSRRDVEYRRRARQFRHSAGASRGARSDRSGDARGRCRRLYLDPGSRAAAELFEDDPVRDILELFVFGDPALPADGQCRVEHRLVGAAVPRRQRAARQSARRVAMAAVGACAAFGTICGSSLATAATMGQVALPEMREYGYSGRAGHRDAGRRRNARDSGPAIDSARHLCDPDRAEHREAVPCRLRAGRARHCRFFSRDPGPICWSGPTARRAQPGWAFRVRLRQIVETWPVVGIFLVVFIGMNGDFFVGRSSLRRRRGPRSARFWRQSPRARSAAYDGATCSVLVATAEQSGMIFLILLGAELYNAFLARTNMPHAAAQWVAALAISPIWSWPSSS